MAITNATRLSDFAAGIGTEGAILKIDNANQRVGIGTQFPSQMLQVAGIVSATQYIGDGSLLEGITSAGLGTAIGDSNTVEEVIYYTNDLLNVTETTTVNPPASASAAYTQYRDVKLNDNVDLIIETGDDFIPDILGFGPDESDPNAAGNGVFDEVYTSIIKNKDGLGAPAFPNGLTSVGVITAASGSFSGNVTVGGVLTYEDVTNIDSVGLITARTGIKVTAGGIDVTAGTIKASTDGINATSNLILKTGGTEQVRILSDGKTGIGTSPYGSSARLQIYEPTLDRALILDSGNANGPHMRLWRQGVVQHYIGCSAGFGQGNYEDLGVRAKRNIIFHPGDSSTERLRIGSAGQIGISGANYGTTGQVFTSQGASAAPQWADAGGVWELIDNKKIESSIGTTYDISFGATAGITTAYARYKIYYNVWLNGGDKIYVRGAYGFSGTFANDVKTSDYWWSGFYHRAGETAMQWPTQGENQNKALIGANNNKIMHSGEMIIFNSSGRLTTNNSASWPVLSYNTQGFSGGDNDAHNFTISGQLKGGDNQPLQGVQIHTGSSMVSGEILTYRLKTT